MKGLLVLLRVVVVGFAVLAGGRALYRNRDRLLDSVSPLKDLVGQLGRQK